MKSVIGFIAFLVGGAGVGGADHAICSAIALSGIIILWKEGKKNRRSPTKANVYKITQLCYFHAYLSIGKGNCKDGKLLK